MNHTPEALQLARELDTKDQALGCPLDRFSDALRHQHARIADLEAQLYAVGAGGVGQSIQPLVQPDTSPAAWAIFSDDGTAIRLWSKDKATAQEAADKHGRPLVPLYTAPQPTENLHCKSTQKRLATLWGYVKQEQARQPLTDQQITVLAEPFGSFEYGDAQGHKRQAFARAIEEAHGITGGQQ